MTMTDQKAQTFSSTLSEEQLGDLIRIEEEVQLKAEQLGMLHGEYQLNLTRILSHYEPMINPLESIIFAGREKQRLMETQIIWLERLVVLQERRGGSTKLFVFDVRRVEDDLLQPANKALSASYQQLDIVTKEELATLREYTCPPSVAITTLTMFMRVRGDDDTNWSAAQIILSDSYFFQFFISRLQTVMRQPLPDDLLDDLEQFCALPEHSPDALRYYSVALGAIGQWLYAARDYHRVKRIVRLPEKPLSAEDRRQALTRLRHELQTVKESVLDASQELKKIQKEAARRAVKVRHEYDDTMCPLEDMLENTTSNFIKVLAGETVEEEEEEVEDEEKEEKEKEELLKDTEE